MLEFNSIYKTLESAYYSSALVPSPTPGFAALPDSYTSLQFSLHLFTLLPPYSWPPSPRLMAAQWAVHCLECSWAELDLKGLWCGVFFVEISLNYQCALVEGKMAGKVFLLHSHWLDVCCFPALLSLVRLLPYSASSSPTTCAKGSLWGASQVPCLWGKCASWRLFSWSLAGFLGARRWELVCSTHLSI